MRDDMRDDVRERVRIVSLAARTVRWSIPGTGAARGRTERTAVLVEARTDTGVVGLGEAAPLPGMSVDSFQLAADEVDRFLHIGRVGLGSAVAARDLVAAAIPIPATRFAFETALLDAFARARGVSLATVLCELAAADGAPRLEPAARVPIAAVVDDPGAARAAIAAGIRCLKLKLTADDDVERAFAIARAAPEARLRIDANRTWPASEVAGRLAALADLPIDYVEEPCPDAHQLLATPLPCKLALDESLVVLSPEELDTALASPGLGAVVLKPTVLGGMHRALAIAALAQRAGVAAIASHCLEGPIGTAACAELALALASAPGADRPAAGLAAHPALHGWSITVEQLAADHVRAAPGPGLGFSRVAGLDLAAVVGACPPSAAR